MLATQYLLTRLFLFFQEKEKKKTIDSMTPMLWNGTVDLNITLHNKIVPVCEVLTICSMLKLFLVLTPSLPYLEPSRVSS